MNRLCMSVLVLIAIFWFSLVLPYFLLQTSQGAQFASYLISKYSHYNVSFGSVTHSFKTPYELTFSQISIADKNQPTESIEAEKLVLGLDKQDITQFNRLNYIFIEKGRISLTANQPLVVQQANILQLKDITITYHMPDLQPSITLYHVHGGATPWFSDWQTQHKNFQFNFTVQKLNYDQIEVQSVFLRGLKHNQTLKFTNVGGRYQQGSFTAKLSIAPNHAVTIEQLSIDRLHLNKLDSVQAIEQVLGAVPQIDIKQLSIVNSSFSQPDMMIERGNLAINDFSYNKSWQFNNSKLSFNAESINWNNELILNPLLTWSGDGEQVLIDQAIFNWNKGTFSTSGHWQNNELTFNNFIVSGFEYVLPQNWYSPLSNIQLPTFLSQVTIKEATLSPSFIVDTDADFPFQISMLEGFAHQLIMKRQNDKTSVNGMIKLKAKHATLNTVELKQPDITFTFVEPNEIYSQFNSLSENGIIEGKANLNIHNAQFTITLNGLFVNQNILEKWHLIENPIASSKFTAQLTGYLQPFKLDGKFNTEQGAYLVQKNRLNVN